MSDKVVDRRRHADTFSTSNQPGAEWAFDYCEEEGEEYRCEIESMGINACQGCPGYGRECFAWYVRIGGEEHEGVFDTASGNE